jgi:hypothetical protein
MPRQKANFSNGGHTGTMWKLRAKRRAAVASIGRDHEDEERRTRDERISRMNNSYVR